MIDDKKMIKLFNERKKIAKEMKNITMKFDRAVESYYGFPFNDTDDDKAIDCLDYGIGNISFEYFIKIMEKRL